MRSWKTIENWFDFQDLYDIVVKEAGPGAKLVEVGVWHGASVVYLAQKAQEADKCPVIYAVDIFVEPFIEDFRRTLEECGVEGLVRPIKSDSTEAAALFDDRSLDFVFIDADHSYEAVKRDLLAWLPKVRPGGIIGGHDYPRPGVKKAVAEALPRAKGIGRTSFWWRVPR